MFWNCKKLVVECVPKAI